MDARAYATDERLPDELRLELVTVANEIERLCDDSDRLAATIARLDARMRAHLAAYGRE